MLARGRLTKYLTTAGRSAARHKAQRKYNLSRKQRKFAIHHNDSLKGHVPDYVQAPSIHRNTDMTMVELVSLNGAFHEPEHFAVPSPMPELASAPSRRVISHTPPSVPDTYQSTTTAASIPVHSAPAVSLPEASFTLNHYLTDSDAESIFPPICTAQKIWVTNSQHVPISPPSQSNLVQPIPHQLEQQEFSNRSGTGSLTRGEEDSCIIITLTKRDIIGITSTASEITSQSLSTIPNHTSTETCSIGGQSYHDSTSINTECESKDDSSIVDITPLIVTTRGSHELIQYDPSIAAGTDTDIEDLIRIATTKETQALAHFLACKILCFDGCTINHYQDMIPGLDQVHSTADQDEIPAMNLHPTHPWDSKSVRAGTERIPSVLEADEFLSPNAYNLTEDVANLLCCGIVKAGKHTYTESLSFMQKGIKVNFSPSRHMNIQADLHILVPLYHYHNNRAYVKHAAICDIPHFHLGHMYGADYYKIFLLLPNLYSEDWKTNYLQDYELEHFMDKIVLPALHMYCPAALLQQLLATCKMAKLESLAAGMEPLSCQTRTSGRTQLLHHLIPPVLLHEIWKTVLEKSSKPGLLDFHEPIIFIDAKNLKLATMASDAPSMISLFLGAWRLQCNSEYVEDESVRVDFTMEEIHERSQFRQGYHDGNAIDRPDCQLSGLEDEAFTLLWRRCCLKSYESAFCHQFLQDSCQFTYYHWALTNDIADLTVTPGKKHSARVAGPAYSQFYTTTKELFDAPKVYPFQNKALEGLAVDPKLKSIWHDIGGQQNEDTNCIKNAYFASKRRAIECIYGSTDKSFGTRQEHRVNMNLLTAISLEFE
ncbi:hypothetical protein L873DRAFT_1788884 [Choiromyces venosus 120613-1]|uniref:Uncharacterized protein n=1 Tax=Choiromyces venosus 120613-1 TaxID=1336337 RepID=A0A3N4JV74_9PEZI|nr:hypothetical protein L873DRAFT_1788884 [Choiromyces venosus 120613-1]